MEDGKRTRLLCQADRDYVAVGMFSSDVGESKSLAAFDCLNVDYQLAIWDLFSVLVGTLLRECPSTT